MAEQEYVCAYKHCLHHGEKVKASQVVIIGNGRYHWDCAIKYKEIKECVDSYVECVGDKKLYPTATRIINTLVFKNEVPVEFIQKNIDACGRYYKNKPVYVLYGLRKLYWENVGRK